MLSYIVASKLTLVRPAGWLITSLFILSSCQKYHTSLPEYHKVFGGTRNDIGYAVTASADGGFVIVGITESFNGDVNGNVQSNGDVWILKIDAQGSKVWQKTYGGPGSDTAYSIVRLGDGGFIIGGSSTSSSGDVKMNRGSTDAWLLKLTAIGDTVWQKTIGGKGVDILRSAAQIATGEIVVAGQTDSNSDDFTSSNGANDAWMLKINPVGHWQWTKSLQLGGTEQDYANALCATTDEGYMMVGQTSSSNGTNTGIVNLGKSDIWIVRMKETNPIWKRTLGGSKDETAQCVVATADSGFVIAGSTYSNDQNIRGAHDTSGKTADLLLARIDGNGKIGWVKLFGGRGNDIAHSVIATADGGFLVAGQTNSTDGDITVSRGGIDAWVIKVDAMGNKLWQQLVGGSGDDVAYALAEVPGRGYIMVGSTTSKDGDIQFNRGGSDVLVTTFKNDY